MVCEYFACVGGIKKGAGIETIHFVLSCESEQYWNERIDTNYKQYFL